MKGRRALLLLLVIAAIAAAAFVWVQNRQFEARVLALRDTVLDGASQAAGSPDLPAIVSSQHRVRSSSVAIDSPPCGAACGSVSQTARSASGTSDIGRPVHVP